ncbi:MAG: DUF2191 domain-containing protein [Acidobacteria bacterium]|nr:DUF2191 domain-containing protein [Acidobacteriota bacterium]
MRTTLTLDPDVAQQIRNIIAQKKLPLKRIVNDALRAGLSTLGKQERATPFRVKPHAFGFKPGVDPDKLNQLLDQLEAEEFSKKLSR